MGLGSTEPESTQKIIKISELVQFTPKQQLALQATKDYRFLLYGGARGGGKSYFIRWWMIDSLVKAWRTTKQERIRGMIGCETYPDLRDRQITKFRTEIPPWIGDVRETKDDGLCFFLAPSLGSGIIALRNLQEPSKYQSAEFAFVAIDELTKNPKQTFDIIRGSMRWPGIDKTRFVGATNPGGIGHGWVKALWLDRTFPDEMKDIAPEFTFVQSLPKDNEHLTQTYWDDLNSLPYELAQAWVEGNWDIFEGMAFPAYDPTQHVCNEFDIPQHWSVWRGLDSGYRDPFCCLWFTRDPSIGRIYVINELYTAGLTDIQQAEMVLDNTPWGNVQLSYADPSMWSRKNINNLVTSAADQYAAAGVPLVKGDNDRILGKMKVDRLLSQKLGDGLPAIQFFRKCKNLIRTLPSLAYADKGSKREDVDTRQEDHAYDALKYGLTNQLIEKPADDKPKLKSPWDSYRSVL